MILLSIKELCPSLSFYPLSLYLKAMLQLCNDALFMNIMSSFAAGALIGDVFIHNLLVIDSSHSSFHTYFSSNNINKILHDLFQKMNF